MSRWNLGWLAGAFAVTLLGLSITYSAQREKPAPGKHENLRLLVDVLGEVKEKYVKELDDDKMRDLRGREVRERDFGGRRGVPALDQPIGGHDDVPAEPALADLDPTALVRMDEIGGGGVAGAAVCGAAVSGAGVCGAGVCGAGGVVSAGLLSEGGLG